ncbi:unnamed protein product [Paramecium sonneborni]|uniref:Uncharacterized protein n=1 Tax=Paramecium sonneborni TaxID=65129 RepID=A0A8S1RQN4_9CILI|nr:unnamed protein product [Paramecium sonneborni]
MYSLDKHDNEVVSLSQIYQKHNQYLVQMVRIKLQFGKEVNKINLNLNILLQQRKVITKKYFEQQNIQLIYQIIVFNLIVNKQFPIVYIKERNLVVVRHKTYIYIIRKCGLELEDKFPLIKCTCFYVYYEHQNQRRTLEFLKRNKIS